MNSVDILAFSFLGGAFMMIVFGMIAGVRKEGFSFIKKVLKDLWEGMEP